MSLSHLTSTATRTATGAVRLGVGVAARTFGLTRGVAKAGAAAARGAARGGGHGPVAASTQGSAEPTVESPPAGSATQAPEDPRDRIPGPDVVAPDLPRAEDLPEPVVIVADDAPAPEPGEVVHHEPKAAGRVSEHEGRPGDREEVEGYLEEVEDTDPAGGDLQQPAAPLADPSTVAAVISESETLRRAAERNPEA